MKPPTPPPQAPPNTHTIRNLTGQPITLLLPDFTYLDLPSEGQAYVHHGHAKALPWLPVPSFAPAQNPTIHDLPPRVANTSIIVSAEVFWRAKRPDLYTPAVGPFDGQLDAQPGLSPAAITRLIGPYKYVAANDDDVD